MKHKVSNLLKSNIKNVKYKYILLGLFLFLLTFATVKATWNIIPSFSSNVKELRKVLVTTAKPIEITGVYWDSVRRSWFVGTRENVNNYHQISSWDELFENYYKGWTTVLGTDHDVDTRFTNNPYNTSELYGVGISTTPCTITFYNISKDELSYAYSEKVTPGQETLSSTWCSDISIPAYRNIFIDPYTYYFVSSFYRSPTTYGDSFISFPYYNNVTRIRYNPIDCIKSDTQQPQLQRVYDGIHADEWWLSHQGDDCSGYSKLYISRLAYDSAQTFINVENITSANILANRSYTTYFDGNNKYYIMYQDGYNPEMLHLKVYEAMMTIQTNKLQLVATQSYNMTELDPNVHKQIQVIQDIWLTKSDTLDKWYLFYTLTNSTASSYQYVNVLTENVTCTCTAWVNTSTCLSETLRRRVRTCTPSGCDISTDTIYDPVFCGVGGEGGPGVKMYHDYKCYSCDNPDLPGGSLRVQDYGTIYCQTPAFVIPSDATNITSTASLSFSVLSSTNFIPYIDSTPNNKYYASICNPVTTGTCQNWTFNCRENKSWSVNLDYNGYLAESTAQANLGILSISNCRASGYGYYTYTFAGDLCVFYDIKCGGWKCTKILDKLYEEYYDTNCNLINTTSCEASTGQNSCDSDTGRCNIPGVVTPPGLLGKDPFGLLFYYSDSAFNETTKFLLGLVLTASFSIFAVLQTKKTDIGIAVGMGFALFFMSLKWFPGFFAVVWVLSLGFLLSKKFWMGRE